jgi:hypothetical protein
MELAIIVGFLLILAVTAPRWGYDSRDGFRRSRYGSDVLLDPRPPRDPAPRPATPRQRHPFPRRHLVVTRPSTN